MGCVKIRYLTRKTARRCARSLCHRHVHAYRCPSCGFWHLGHLDSGVIAGNDSRLSVYGDARA